MKKIVIAAVCFVTSAFAEQLVLDNQTSYPAKNQKIAIQWASSAQEVDASNKALLAGEKFSPAHLQALKQTGKIDLTIPKNTAYFRLVAWSKEGTRRTPVIFRQQKILTARIARSCFSRSAKFVIEQPLVTRFPPRADPTVSRQL